MIKIKRIFLMIILLTACATMGIAEDSMEKANRPSKELKKATFAGGCFWCTESDYEKLPGVIDVVSGYMGGTIDNPSYNQVVKGDIELDANA